MTRIPALANWAARVARRAALATGLVAALAAFVSLEALFAPDAEPWPRWRAHDAASTSTVDHTAWDRFLAAYLVRGEDGINRLRYGGVGAADRAALESYVEGLSAIPISRYNRAEQLAFWINLYNALTVRVVLDHYPVASIRDIDISPGLFADGPWTRKLVTVEGEALSLNDIEHRILRPIWADPRLHYALNCAALGCPNLQPTAFTGANAEALMEAGARAYVNHPRGARMDNGALVVSSIYVWFAEDFGGGDRDVIAHLRRYAEPGLAAALAGASGIADHRYDWRLNAVAGRGAGAG